MTKIILLQHRLPGVTREEFETHYEDGHTLLLQKLLPGIKSFRRNYVRGRAIGGAGVGEEAPFDLLAELTFEDRVAFEAFATALRTPEIELQIRADEAPFLDSAKSTFLQVREDVSAIPLRADEPKPRVKLALFLSRRPHVTPAQFADYYDHKHAPFMAALLPWIRVYNRNHVIGAALAPQKADDEPPFNTFTELRFKDAEAVRDFRAEFSKPEVLAKIRADEANFLQGDKSRLFEVNERVSAS